LCRGTTSQAAEKLRGKSYAAVMLSEVVNAIEPETANDQRPTTNDGRGYFNR